MAVLKLRVCVHVYPQVPCAFCQREHHIFTLSQTCKRWVIMFPPPTSTSASRRHPQSSPHAFCFVFYFGFACSVLLGVDFCLVTLTECSDPSVRMLAILPAWLHPQLVLCWDQSCCECLSECHSHIYDQMTGSLSLSLPRDLIVVSETWPLIGL